MVIYFVLICQHKDMLCVIMYINLQAITNGDTSRQ